MQYVFFSEKRYTHTVQWGIFENFCVKSNLTVCKVTFNCKLQKKMGKQGVLVAPPIILLGATVPPDPPPMFTAFHS